MIRPILRSPIACGVVVLAAASCSEPRTAEPEGPDLGAGATVEERVLFYDGLGEPGAEANIERLARAIGRDHVEVQLTAIEALGRIGSPGVVPALERACGDELSVMRVAVAQAAVQVEAPAQLALLHRLTSDSSLKVRRAAANSLARLHRAESVPFLVAAIEREDDEGVRRAAIQGLGKVGPAAEPALSLLVDLSVTERESLRWDAVEAIRSIGNERAVEALVEHVVSDVPEIRGRACLALAELGAPRGIERILDALAVERYDVAAAAMARAAALLGERAVAFEVLERILLRGDPWQSRLEATVALGESGTAEHIALLQEALHDPIGMVREHAGEAIERIRSRHTAS